MAISRATRLGSKDQLLPISDEKIQRGTGFTDSERFLIEKAENTFLNLWCIPNTFIDKKQNGKGTGKELCDVLAICGDDVIIFSDKATEWPSGDLKVAWNRWYRKTISNSIRQISGAARWINEHPDRIFLDAACTKPLPMPMPPAERRRVHGIVVANGAAQQAKEYFGGGIGSFVLSPGAGDTGEIPFTIGDNNPDGIFVHVLTEATLEIVLGQLDTITDLCDYLSAKEELVRSGRLIAAAGEEELLAIFLTNMTLDGRHGFPSPSGSEWRDGERVMLDEGFWSELKSDDRYKWKKDADKVSYIWDYLIKTFTDNILGGTLLKVEGWDEEYSHEVGVRYMALAPRIQRRVLGAAISEAINRDLTGQRLCRGMISRPETRGSENGFFLLVLSVPDNPPLEGGYEQYREVRRNLLAAYADGYLRNFPYLDRVVGVGLEPVLPLAKGRSEDLVYASRKGWNDERVAASEEVCKRFGIMQPGMAVPRFYSVDEYPAPPPQPEKRTKRGARRARARQRHT